MLKSLRVCLLSLVFTFPFLDSQVNATTISVSGYSNVLVGSLPGSISSFGDAVFDSSGNAYVSSRVTGPNTRIYKVTPGGTISTFLTTTSGINDLTGLAISGNDLYASFENGTIEKADITAGSPSLSAFATVASSSVHDIAIAPANSPYAGQLVYGVGSTGSSSGLGRIDIPNASTTPVQIQTGLPVTAIDFDANGDLFYVSSFFGNGYLRKLVGTSYTQILYLGSGGWESLAVDLSTGDLFVGNSSESSGGNTLKIVSGGSPSTFATNIDFDNGFFQDVLTFSPDGSYLLYAEGESSSTLYKITGFPTDYFPAVPEPGTLALFGIGLAGLGFARRRKAAA